MNSPLSTQAPNTIPHSVDNDQKHSLLRQKWQAMELGLNDIKVALGALKSACAVLEIQTERLGNEMLEITEIIGPFILEPCADEGSQSAHENEKASDSSRKPRSGLITPPGTPARSTGILHRLNQSIDRIVHPDHISTAIFSPPRTELLGKRRLLEDTDDSTDDSVNANDHPIQRASKRVRFADTEDIPISHIRTPMHQLNTASGSKDLPLPIPKGVPDTENKSVESTLSEDTPIEAKASPISPPSSPIILPVGKARNTRPRFRDSMTYLRHSQHPRQKTRWDPTIGKRVPVATLPSASTSIEDTVSTSTEDDYEGRLSHNLSNTSIG